MQLVSAYAPEGLSNPCLVISTICSPGAPTKETAMALIDKFGRFEAIAEALNGPQAWVVVKKHRTLGAAAEYHLSWAKRLHIGGSNKARKACWPVYEEACKLIESKKAEAE